MAESLDTQRKRGPLALGAAIVAIAVALAVGLFVGSSLGGDDATAATPATDSVDAGFARDMQAHHAQAVEMSILVRDATDDPEVRTLAFDILTTQQQQIGQMYAWLDLWGLDQRTTEPPMAWMPADSMGEDHDMSHMQGAQSMPGMASDADMERLATLTGVEAEKLYLELMIPHHQGGVSMAEVAAEEAETPQVRRLAQGMAEAQTAEIEYLQELLEAR